MCFPFFSRMVTFLKRNGVWGVCARYARKGDGLAGKDKQAEVYCRGGGEGVIPLRKQNQICLPHTHTLSGGRLLSPTAGKRVPVLQSTENVPLGA